MFDLSGKTALVTGASGGIGGAIARALHKQGATVTLSGTRADVLEQLKASPPRWTMPQTSTGLPRKPRRRWARSTSW
jgi:NADP-dependent 3-hydroxy acid dehydrogenase YdfG